MEATLNFSIKSNGEISKLFIQKAIQDFEGAVHYIRHLPYGRNANKKDLRTVFSDNLGTCSTKHALLKTLATENDIKPIELILGIFKMSAQNTPAVAAVLQRNNLAYIPEAHNYLKMNGMILDCTRRHSSEDDFIHDLLEETVIEPDQITSYKTSYHKSYLEKWLLQQDNIHLSLDELWEIREECIKALSE